MVRTLNPWGKPSFLTGVHHLLHGDVVDSTAWEYRARAAKQVHDLKPDAKSWWMLDGPGNVTPEQSALLLYASLLRVEGGLSPLLGLDLTQWHWDGREPGWRSRGGTATGSKGVPGALSRCVKPEGPYGGWRCGERAGPEVGEAGEQAADACVLSLGYALLLPDGISIMVDVPE